MNFGAGMAAGMGAGMGSGIAVGMAAGQNQTKTKIRDYAEQRGITVSNPAGKPIHWDEFLDEALACRQSSKTGVLIGLTVAGVLVLVGLGLTLFFWWR